MKTRYAIIEPGPIRHEDLFSLKWVDCEFRESKPAKPSPLPLSQGDGIPYSEFSRILDPLFPGADWERVQVNSFKGPTDMFVDDHGAPCAKNLPINEGATLIYWTATIMHQLDREAGAKLPTYQVMQIEALKRAARALKGEEVCSGLYRETPRIHGLVVLFEERVWF